MARLNKPKCFISRRDNYGGIHELQADNGILGNQVKSDFWQVHQGLPTIKVGRSKRISKTAIDKFMAEHQSSTKD